MSKIIRRTNRGINVELETSLEAFDSLPSYQKNFKPEDVVSLVAHGMSFVLEVVGVAPICDDSEPHLWCTEFGLNNNTIGYLDRGPYPIRLLRRPSKTTAFSSKE